MPLAYALARSWAWPALKFRCETHPQEVAEIAVDSRGETILHWTCLGKPPIETVQAILDVCPFMAEVRNMVGHLPLHVAISYRASVEVVRALLEAYPESAGLPNGVGAYPLHLLCDYGSCVDSLRAVLETPAGAATIEKSMRATKFDRSQTPLDILSTRMNYAVFRRAILSMKQARKQQQAKREAMLQKQKQKLLEGTEERQPPQTGNENNAEAAFDRNERMIASFQQNDYWQKAALLVLVAYTQQPLSPQGLEYEEANLVHACAGVPDCPSYLLEFAVLLHMEELMEKKDHLGRLPLHVAAQNHARRLVHKPSSNETSERSRRRRGTEDPLGFVLEACPAAAFVMDLNGDLPLAVALKEIRQQTAGKAWSNELQQLLDANVAALETLNLEEGVYPYIWSQRMTAVDHLFESIRRHPDLFDRHHRGGSYTLMDGTAGC